MNAQVTVMVVRGPLAGRTLVYTEPDTCLIGRNPDCHLVVPDDKDHVKVSRYQCRLEIHPPSVRLHDLKSRNGTVVAGRAVTGEVDLRDGDEVELGATVLRVGVLRPGTTAPTEEVPLDRMPAVCDRCWCDVPEDLKAAWAVGDGSYLCPKCRARGGEAVCMRCGRALPVGPLRPAELLCAACQAGPGGLLDVPLPPPLPRIDGYAVQRELGKGGMGVVYLAREEATGAEVALKVMLPTVAVHPKARDLFQREMRAIRLLDHPNIVRLLDTGCSGGTFYFTMEYCAGGTVRDLVKARGPLAVAEAIDLTLQALAGLDHAHNARIPGREDAAEPGGRGVVHRDLSPDNLFLAGAGPDRLCKLGDYGLATAVDRAGLSGHTRTGTMGGKPAFVCRHQVRSYRGARPEVDVWAVAACLYAMLTGSPPRDFPPGRDPWTIVLESALVPIRQRRPDVPGPLAELIDRALDDAGDLRFATAAGLRDALVAV